MMQRCMHDEREQLRTAVAAGWYLRHGGSYVALQCAHVSLHIRAI